MFDIDDRDTKELEKDLKTFNKKALPFATKNTLNGVAFATRKLSVKKISKEMILKNKFTKQSIRVDQSRTLKISRQAAAIGSTEPYMKTQEFGGTKVKQGKHGIPLTTSYAAGQALSKNPRSKLARPENQLASIQLKKRKKPKNNKQALLRKVQIAVETGKREFYHRFDSTSTAGIFTVEGGSKGTKRGWPEGAKLRMLHDLTHESVDIPKNPWLKPSTEDGTKLIPELYKKSLLFQLRRNNIFQG